MSAFQAGGIFSLRCGRQSGEGDAGRQKYPFENSKKIATILPKEHLFQPILRAMATACRHPKVRIVSRHEDTEFVECLECGEVFDSEEFRDMEIEDTADPEGPEEDS
jgi:hypothetical protein